MIGVFAASVSSYLWTPIIFGVATIAIVALLGIHALRTTATASAVFSEVLSHTIGGLAIYVGLSEVVPRYNHIFKEFDAELPGIAILLIRISETFLVYWPSLVAPLLGMLVADAAVFYAFHKEVSTRSKARLWSAGITGLVVIAILFSIAAVAGPSIKLWNDLQ